MLDGLRGTMTRVLTPVAALLLRLGVGPDAVTVGGTVVVVVTALWALPTGHFTLGALVIAATALADSLDGVMARASGRSGPWGAFLDSTMDRFADGAIFAGLVLWYAGRPDAQGQHRWGLALALACLVLGSIVPYARARAEGIGLTAKVGIAERADRLMVVLVGIFAVGVGAPALVLVVVLGLLAVASAITVGQRVATVRSQARAASGAS